MHRARDYLRAPPDVRLQESCTPICVWWCLLMTAVPLPDVRVRRALPLLFNDPYAVAFSLRAALLTNEPIHRIDEHHLAMRE